MSQGLVRILSNRTLLLITTLSFLINAFLTLAPNTSHGTVKSAPAPDQMPYAWGKHMPPANEASVSRGPYFTAFTSVHQPYDLLCNLNRRDDGC